MKVSSLSSISLPFAKKFLGKCCFVSFFFVPLHHKRTKGKATMTYNIEKITTLIGARRYGNTPSTIGWLLTDSRSLCFPEQTLFFALRTQRNDGHRYIAELYRRGVRNFVIDQLPPVFEKSFAGSNFLKVPSHLAALQRLAERHRDEFIIPVVGITGSNGKTWVKEWLYQILMPSIKTTR